MARRIVVLPLPDGPTMATSSPGATARPASSGIGASWRSAIDNAESAGSDMRLAPMAGKHVDEADGNK